MPLTWGRDMSTPSAAALLKHQLRHSWLNARRMVDDLTEDEYFWEPATPCWSVRRCDASIRGWGAGDFVCEDTWPPPPEPLPTTTIAWRVVHLAAWTDIYRGFAFEDTRPDLNDADVPGSASEGLGWLIRAQDGFLRAVDGLGEDAVFDPRPPHWGESVPLAGLITTMMTEHVHHLAEIGALRDGRRGHAVNLPPASVPSPDWWEGQ